MEPTISKATKANKLRSEDGDKKSSNDSEYITLKVKSTDGSELCFKIRRSTKLKKLMDTYHMLDSNFPFLFDGRRLREEQTPDEAGLVDGDEIDVIKPMYGIGTNLIKRGFLTMMKKLEKKKKSAEERVNNSPNGSGQKIIVKVIGEDGTEVFFRIKRNTKLIQLMRAYCDRISEDIRTYRFLFEGRFLQGEKTPDQVGIEDGDEIDAMWRM